MNLYREAKILHFDNESYKEWLYTIEKCYCDYIYIEFVYLSLV